MWIWLHPEWPNFVVDASGFSERVETRLEWLRRLEEVDRAVFHRENLEMAGAVVNIDGDGKLRVIQGLVMSEDLAAAPYPPHGGMFKAGTGRPTSR